MKRLLLILSIVFNALAIVGAVYVLGNKGIVNAGYAITPMVIGLACLAGYRAYKSKNE